MTGARALALVLAAALLGGCPARHLDARYRPGEGPVEAWRAVAAEGAAPRVGLVPLFDTRWLARSSGYADGATILGTIGGRPIQLTRGGEIVLVADFVHEALLGELRRAGADVVDLRNISIRDLADAAALARATREERLEYIVLGDLVAFDYSYVDRGPGSLWGADVAFGLSVVAVGTGRVLMRELVDASWRGDPTGEGEAETDLAAGPVIERWLVDRTLREACERALVRIAAAVARDRARPAPAAESAESADRPEGQSESEGEAAVAPAPPPAAPDPFAPRSEPVPAGAEGLSDWTVIDAAGTLEIDSDPRGARVTFDDRAIGETPLRLSGLRPGERIDLLVQHPGYRPFLETIEMPAARGLSVRVRLAPLRRR